MSYKVAVLPGDGIGPEVMESALQVLAKVEEKFGFKLELTTGHIGGIAYDETGSPLPEETQKICKEADAVLLGSIGGPKWDGLPPEKTPELGGLLALRKMLKLYANLRPAVLYEELKAMSPLSEKVLSGKVDLLTVRELANGIYFGEPKELTDTMGLDTMIYTVDQVQAIAKQGFEAAQRRRKKLCSVDKANVLCSSKLWRQVVTDMASDYPDVELSHMYVDNAAMQLMLNPLQFDVILTSNLFGDILSDESAAICGSLGMLPSASIGKDISLFEPSGGSAPDIAGKGIANPIAQILSLAMMLEISFDLNDVAEAIRNAVDVCVKGGIRTGDIIDPGMTPVSTKEMTEAIISKI
ncbi:MULTISPECIES: 3-isopropylmalate dehydrogenase [unclassified Oceanispirochaeta]|uniref:3-isopropylmalate dehydrogenase n=1 Tax=unclassified Oceanispirochaeta TaxID=2635722 RepID=UPI000E08ED68|nr:MULTISPECIES: 3-isopropylmalate dehydrogenase [unclassified Oceanispirochaeta]MBF9015789.1 3-isopropylmalate dehydrogenase [Oceanispirochaeta sp. M2]NPD72252.1 3-isopropylmalate dehydrogenase [Oceanispirochaeta sp. M1]RDG32348.1 3-isopropylmalate dehydrogenase [Oceanispirochaeta sp. M1]